MCGLYCYAHVFVRLVGCNCTDCFYLLICCDEGPLGEFQTRCDYNGLEQDELSFKKGLKVEVLEARLDGWWRVRFL